MAFIDTSHLDRKPTSPVAFEALMAQLDTRRIELSRQRPAVMGEAPAHLHFVQQMLLAATVAAGLIVAVAGVMMLKFL